MIVNHSTTEEPYEVKVSRTVLETSRRGDPTAEFNYLTVSKILPMAARVFGVRFAGRDAATNGRFWQPPTNAIGPT